MQQITVYTERNAQMALCKPMSPLGISALDNERSSVKRVMKILPNVDCDRVNLI